MVGPLPQNGGFEAFETACGTAGWVPVNMQLSIAIACQRLEDGRSVACAASFSTVRPRRFAHAASVISHKRQASVQLVPTSARASAST